MVKTLTDRGIAALKPAVKGQRYVVSDALMPALVVRVTDKGNKTFLLGARYPNSKNFIRRELGRVGILTLAEAREKARDWQKLLRDGIDPRDVERRKRIEAERKRGDTFASLAELYIARCVKSQRSGVEAERIIHAELAPRWGKRPLTEVTRGDVIKMIDEIVGRGAPAQAHNAFALVRAMFNWAIDRGLCETSPADRLRPTKLIGIKQPRLRVLTDDELRAIWQAADVMGYPYGPLVRLLMLTGQRRGEAAGARWREFDFARRVWSIPPERFKSNATHVLPLADDAWAMLAALPRWAGGDCVFTTVSGKKPINGYSKAKKRLDQLTGLEDWTIHDIRRTVRTRLSALRVPEPVAEMVIGHSRRGLIRVYDQHTYLDEMREALMAWEARLRSIISSPPDSVVAVRAGI
jgi:integrase